MLACVVGGKAWVENEVGETVKKQIMKDLECAAGSSDSAYSLRKAEVETQPYLRVKHWCWYTSVFSTEVPEILSFLGVF